MKTLDDVQDDNYDLSYSTPNSMFDWLNDNLPNGSKILEFGSGTGTIELTKSFDVTSIEDNEEWLYLAQDSTYIYAPLVNDWYDWQALEILQDETFEAIIIDGPYNTADRIHLIDWINVYPNVFNQARFVVVDDVFLLTGETQFIKLFKQLGWECLHHNPGSENHGHNWSVYVTIHECPECGEEFNRYTDMIECCANL
jgi:precorrin-6B methylase 2